MLTGADHVRCAMMGRCHGGHWQAIVRGLQPSGRLAQRFNASPRAAKLKPASATGNEGPLKACQA